MPGFSELHNRGVAQGPGADPGFEKGGFNVVPKSDTGGATNY